MGDPECQTILPKLNSDLLEIFLACCNESLNKTEIKWSNKKSLCIVLCSKGYPEKIEKNVEIKNINNIKLNKDEHCYHAGTINEKEKTFAIGGRVLNFVCLSKSFSEARLRIFNLIDSLNWRGGFFRKDIGHKVIDE